MPSGSRPATEATEPRRPLASAGAGLALSIAALFAAPAGGEPRWSPYQQRLLDSLHIDRLPAPAAMAADGNAVRADVRAARLGQAIFFDPRFSADGQLSCASCHRPALSFSDGRARSLGRGPGRRNTPGLLGVAHQRWLFHDGRRDSLWSQALVPLERADEMGADRLSVLRRLFAVTDYRVAYQSLFGRPPGALLAAAAAPASPLGDERAQSNWRTLAPDARAAIDRHFANVGKVIAAWESRLRPPRAPFDHFVAALAAGDQRAAEAALSGPARAGLRRFLDPANRCLFCHSGPLFSDGAAHNIGTGTAIDGSFDRGWGGAEAARQADPFRCGGGHDSGPPRRCAPPLLHPLAGAAAVAEGAFRTPSLRQLRFTAPYFHDGRAADLRAVLEHYRSPPPGAGAAHELWPLRSMDERVIEQLLAFLDSLSAPLPAAGWYAPPAPGGAGGAASGGGPAAARGYNGAMSSPPPGAIARPSP